MAPDLLRRRIPILVSVSNYFVALCNFSVTYFFPMWFETVQFTSASVAGEKLVEQFELVVHLRYRSSYCTQCCLDVAWLLICRVR
jgi:hypothetical protein